MDSSSSVPSHEFLRAAALSDLELLRTLVDNGEGNFEKIRDSNGCTALHFAAVEGHTLICKYLIETLKFNVDLQDDNGHTPLAHAINTHKLETAFYLVENGASMAITDNGGCTALHLAVLRGGGKKLLQLFISKGADIEAVSNGGTALSGASLIGDSEAVEFLLQNNANINPINTPIAPIMAASYISLACLDLLIKAGANPNFNFGGATPLQNAAVTGNVDIIRYLLKAGANPDTVNYVCETPLEIAALVSKNVEAVSVLYSVTTPIPWIPDWSVEGIINYVKSKESQEKTKIMEKEFVQVAKSNAAEAFKREEYWVAINWYMKAESVDRYNATIYSNKSLCFARLNRAHGALYNAREALKLKPNWPKKYNEATKSYSIALKLDPNNMEIQKALQEAVEAEIANVNI